MPFTQYFPAFEAGAFLGTIASKTHHYQIQADGQIRTVFCAWIIAQEDSAAWVAFRELLDYSLQMAAAQMKGFFGLELLSLELGESLQSFSPVLFAQLLANHSKALHPGGQTLFQYGRLWFLLSKRITEEWGKIECKPQVEIYSGPPAQFDLFLKKRMRAAESICSRSQGKPLWMIFDLSSTPVFRFGEEEQTARMLRWFESFKKNRIPLPEIRMIHAGKIIDLALQFGLH